MSDQTKERIFVGLACDMPVGSITEVPLDGALDPPVNALVANVHGTYYATCLLYTSPSPRDRTRSRMPSSA